MAVIDQIPSGKWRARVRRRDSRPQSKTFLHKIDAEGWARKIESAIERGTWRDNVTAESTSLAVALAKYEKVVLPKMRGQRGEKSIIRILLDEPEAGLPLSKIDASAIAVMRDRWSADGYRPGTIRRRFHTLSHLFTVASVEWDMKALSNPVRSVSLPREDNARERRVSDAELDALRAAGSNTRHLPDFITLAVETAMRREELTSARWRHVNTATHTLRIPKTKNGDPRTIPLSPRAIEVLLKMPRDSGDHVFAWARPDSATQAFVRAARRARQRYIAECKDKGIEPNSTFLHDVRLHDLRHEAISRLASIFGVHELARITGHKTLGMLMRYYHPRAEDFAARMRRVETSANSGHAPTKATKRPPR